MFVILYDWSMQVAINNEDIKDLFHSASTKYKIKKYHGPPCHPNPCLNGFLCIALFDSYRCDPR